MQNSFSPICFTFALVPTTRHPISAKAQVCYDKSTYLNYDTIFGFSSPHCSGKARFLTF